MLPEIHKQDSKVYAVVLMRSAVAILLMNLRIHVHAALLPNRRETSAQASFFPLMPTSLCPPEGDTNKRGISLE